MKQTSSLVLSVCTFALVIALGGCEAGPKPDNRIKLVPSADGRSTIAVPPECLNWQSAATSPLENHAWPQYGCAQARNLAAQVERPEDLIEGKQMGGADGVVSAASVQNYRAGKTKALIDAKADAPIAQAATGTGGTP